MDAYKIAEKMARNGELKTDIKNNFVNICVFKNLVKEFNGKNGKKIYVIYLSSDENHQKPNARLSFLLSDAQLSKNQPQDGLRMSFWLFADQKIKVQKSIKNDAGNWIYDVYKMLDARTLKEMTYSPKYYEKKTLTQTESVTNNLIKSESTETKKVNSNKDLMKQGVNEINNIKINEDEEEMG